MIKRKIANWLKYRRLGSQLQKISFLTEEERAKFKKSYKRLATSPLKHKTRGGEKERFQVGANTIVAFDSKHLFHLVTTVFVDQEYRIERLSESPVILDCGANIGAATLYFKMLYPKAKVISFEPDPEAFSLLKENVDANNLDNVTIHNKALYNEDSEISFFVHSEVPGSLIMSIDQSRTGKASTEIKVKSVLLSDHINEPIDLMKIDIEGAEHSVFQDLVETGKIRLIKNMIIEYHHFPNKDASLAGFLMNLEENGFSYFIDRLHHVGGDKESFQDIIIHARSKN